MKILVNNGSLADEIYMNKEGKYITLRKPEDPRKEFRYDLSNHEFERITHYKTREDKIDIVDPAKITSWFTHCNLVTNDDKFAKMFVYAAGLNMRYRSPIRYIANFATWEVERLEKWLSRDIDFRKLNECLERIQHGSDIDSVRRMMFYVGYDPDDFDKEQIKYIRDVSKKSNGITDDTLRQVRYSWNPQQYKMGKKLDELIEDQRYNDAFLVTEFSYTGNKEVYNYLEHSRYGRDGRTSILEVVSEWQLDLKAKIGEEVK